MRIFSIFLLALGLLLVQCRPSPYVGNGYDPPRLDRSFTQVTPPPAPNYSLDASWAALPWKKDMADTLPLPGMSDGQAKAKADVFYVHPTIYLDTPPQQGYYWNADVNDAAMNASVDGSAILNQATVFNESCRVFAPRYRQAHIYSFYTPDRASGEAALELAYQDVKSAFLHFLTQHSNTRPFILAGHSQGTRHAGKLLREVILPDTALRKRLIAAYLVGMPVPPGLLELPLCDQPGETGCFTSWCTYRKGFYPSNFRSAGYDRSLSVNPLSWTTDSAYVDRRQNKGGIIWRFDKVIRGINGAGLKAGMLWIEKPKVPGRMFIRMDNYHVADYNLFWFNSRENVRQQVENYLQQNH